jgi:hypothetical protein
VSMELDYGLMKDGIRDLIKRSKQNGCKTLEESRKWIINFDPDFDNEMFVAFHDMLYRIMDDDVLWVNKIFFLYMLILNILL